MLLYLILFIIIEKLLYEKENKNWKHLWDIF